MNEPTAARAPVVPLLLLGVLALVLLEHLRALFGTASFEHLSQIVNQLIALDGGMGSQDRLVTGGGGLVFRLHWLVRELGLPYEAMHGLYAILDLCAVVAWVLIARRWLPAPVLWCSALVLATYGVPKQYLVENSTLMAFTAPPLLACLAMAVQRDSMRWLVAAAILLALSTHLGLLALFALPVALIGLWTCGFTRWMKGSALLTAAALLPVLPIWGADGASNPLFEELAFRFRAEHLLQTSWGIVGYLWSFVGHPVVIAGVGAILFAAPLRRSVPLLWLGLLWMLATAIPAAILDQFEEPYHFAMASPGRAVVAGFGLFAAGEALQRVTRVRLGWTPLLAGVMALACVGSLAMLGWALLRADAVGEDEDLGTPCASWDQGCHRVATERLLTQLDEAGVLPAPDQPVTFHGVSQNCLNATWYWRSSQLMGDRRGDMGGEKHLLLMARHGEGDPAELAGAVVVGDVVVLPGVQPLEWYEDLEAHPEPPYSFSVPGVGPGQVYVGLETSRSFSAGEVFLSRGEATAPTIARCDNDRVDGYRHQYDGFFVFEDSTTAGEGDLRIDIHADIDDSEPPETVDVLLLPTASPPDAVDR